MQEWYYSTDHETMQGPCSSDEIVTMIQEGSIQPNAVVYSESIGYWANVAEVDEFKVHFKSLPPKIPAIPKDENTDRKSNEAANKAFEGAQKAYKFSADMSGKSTVIWKNALYYVKQGLNQNFMETIFGFLSKYGLYSMFLAALAVFSYSVIQAIKQDKLSMIGYGLLAVVGISALQFLASSFLSSSARIIKGSKTSLSSTAYTDAIALLLLFMVVFFAFTGVRDALDQDELFPLLTGLSYCLSSLLVTGVILNPTMLNIDMVDEQVAGEEAIGILSLLMKSSLRCIPAIFGVLIIVGSIFMILGIIKEFTSDNSSEGYIYAMQGLAMVGIGGVLPMVSSLIFLFYYLLIDLMSATLLIPKKLDSLIQEYRQLK